MITVIGLDGSPLSRRAEQAVARATLLVGGRRHLAAAGWPSRGRDGAAVPYRNGASPGRPGAAPVTGPGPRVVVMGPLRPALDTLAAHDGDAVVLASGDPGFFGIVRALRDRGLDCVVLPATSSVTQAFARAGLPWDDAIVVSAHGRELPAAVNVCRAHPKVAVLTGPGQGPAEVGAALAGWPRRLLVAEDLGTPGERLTECSPAEAAQRTWADPNVVLSLAASAPDPARQAPRTPAPQAPTPQASQSVARPAPTPPAPDPSANPPAPSPGDGEFGSSDHEGGGPPDDPTTPASHTGLTGESAGGHRPADQSVIMTLVSPERHQCHDHEERHAPAVPTGLTNHTGPSEPEPGGPGPSEPDPGATEPEGQEPGGQEPSESGPDGRPGPTEPGPGPGRRGRNGPGASGPLPDGLGRTGPGLGGPDPSWCWPLWPGTGDAGWALAEEAFEHRDSMVTKPEVRALALARLGPRPGTLVWDVGAGSGSVAVECARFGAAVIAVERDPAQCARVAANASRHRAEVRVVGGTAPGALAELPDPDAVFVGGGGLAVVSAVAARRPARIVVALAAVQRAGPAIEALAGAGYVVDGTLLQASRLAPLPDGAHRLAAANPVFLLWAALDHDHGQVRAL